MAFGELFSWIAFVVLAMFGLSGILGNWIGPVQAVITKKNFSMIPLLGGICGAVACAISPLAWLRPYWWVALVADLSILLAIPTFTYIAIVELRKRKSGDNHG